MQTDSGVVLSESATKTTSLYPDDAIGFRIEFIIGPKYSLGNGESLQVGRSPIERFFDDIAEEVSQSGRFFEPLTAKYSPDLGVNIFRC